jgi:DNA-binding MarR family transcriptional regulator
MLLPHDAHDAHDETLCNLVAYLIAWGMETTSPLLFGDLLALARERWVRVMAQSVAEKGYPGYRRSDALAARFLRPHSRTLGEFASRLGGSRQATRKVVTGLVERGYATLEPDPHDARRRHVTLTSVGRAYADAVLDTVTALNRDVADKVSPEELAAATSVLAFVKDGLATVG